MTDIKFCKDCKYYWYRPGDISGYSYSLSQEQCTRKILNLISGEMFSLDKCCNTERTEETLCGKEAKYFEPKEE